MVHNLSHFLGFHRLDVVHLGQVSAGFGRGRHADVTVAADAVVTLRVGYVFQRVGDVSRYRALAVDARFPVAQQVDPCEILTAIAQLKDNSA